MEKIPTPRNPESRPLPTTSMALDHGVWPEGGLFDLAIFGQAKALGAPYLRGQAQRWVVGTPGTLGEFGAWRLDGHRLSAINLLSAFFPERAEGKSPAIQDGIDASALRAQSFYGIVDGEHARTLIVATAAFCLLYPEELKEHALERDRAPLAQEITEAIERSRSRVDAQEITEGLPLTHGAAAAPPRI